MKKRRRSMRTGTVICGCVAMIWVFVLVCLAAEPGAPPVWPQMTAVAIGVFEKYSPSWDLVLAWPKADETTFTTDQIPEKFRVGAAQWLAKVLKEKYLEPDLAKKMIGVRRTLAKPKGRQIDELFTRYVKEDATIQACENDVSLTILVEMRGEASKKPEDWQSAQCYVTDVFCRVFREPKVPLDHVRLYMRWSELPDKHRVFYGTLNVDPNVDVYPEVSGKKRYWHDSVEFLVDGAKLVFSFEKKDGEVDILDMIPKPAGTRW
jgi:hypothetical protein